MKYIYFVLMSFAVFAPSRLIFSPIRKELDSLAGA
jgi:hypothetical protein